MTNPQKLLLIKTLHTAIWAFFVGVILYVIYCGVADRVGRHTWVAAGLVVAEGVVLLLFGGSCPLTLAARQYSRSGRSNFDIFLPEWLARINKPLFTTLFLLGLLAVAYRRLS